MDTLTSGPAGVNGLRGPTAAEAEAVARLIGHPPENAPRKVRDLYRPIDVHGKAPTWPETVPTLTGPEALVAAKKLWRHVMGKPWPGQWKLTSGNRYTKSDGMTIYVNPDRGWKHLVHGLSHAAYWRLRRNVHGAKTVRPKSSKPYVVQVPLCSPAKAENYRTAKRGHHTDDHALLEKEMVAYVVSNGWLDGLPQPKPRIARPKPAPIIIEHDRVLARIKAWQTKAKRAATALAKLRKEEARLRRRRERTVIFTLD